MSDDRFRRAIEAKDVEALSDLLADNVEFRSPAVFKPYLGKETCTAIITAVMDVFDDFHYLREFSGNDGADHALEFEATVDGVVVNGCDFLHYDADGLIDDFKVMVRTVNGLNALATAMGPRFPAIEADAIARMKAAGKL